MAKISKNFKVAAGVLLSVIVLITVLWSVIYSKRWASVRAVHTKHEIINPAPNRECVVVKSSSSVAVSCWNASSK